MQPGSLKKKIKRSRTSGGLLKLHSSRKNPYLPHEKSLENPSGRGVLKAKILETKYEA